MDEIKQLVSEMKFNVLDMTEFGKGVLYIDYDENTNELFAGDCTNCGRCIDVCAPRVFKMTHRFDQRSA